MSKITASIRFQLSEHHALGDGIDGHSDLKRYTFAEWAEHAHKKLLNVGDFFLYNDDQYLIDAINTQLDVRPVENVSEDEIGNDTLLTVYYFVSKVE